MHPASETIKTPRMGHDGHDHDHQHHPHGHGHAGHSSSAQEHKSQAPVSVAAFVVTCSDSRAPGQDESGRTLRELLERAGHTVCGQTLIPDEAAQLRAAVETARSAGARALLVTGGTGVGRRDVTLETLRPLFDKELPGFGELFRALSFAEIGSPAMLSRAAAGTVQGMVVFALPGSPHACRLAMERLILPELGHLVRELSR